MGAKQAIHIPDIGGASGNVIEILVKVGDAVAMDAPLITLEGDKATMDVPSPMEGVVASIDVSMGQSVSEGDACVTLEVEHVADPEETESNQADVASEQTFHLPDLGSGASVRVLEWLVEVGSEVDLDQPLATLEGEKATMDLPSPAKGVLHQHLIHVGDDVATGDPWVVLLAKAERVAPTVSAPSNAVQAPAVEAKTESLPSLQDTMVSDVGRANVHASPSVRAYAREYGVDLSRLKGSGPKGRVRNSDVRSYIMAAVQAVQNAQIDQAPATKAPPSRPPVDFAQFGPIREEALPRIKQISGPFLQGAWQEVPHVTQLLEVDITALEAHRKVLNVALAKIGTKSSPLMFIIKALAAAMQQHPSFCSSLSEDGKKLILKDYFNVGVAVDTPGGLVVAVIRDVDKKDIAVLSKEIRDTAEQARTKGLTPKQMQGGCMSVSSLGGLGAGPFTPIVNVPEVAILGVAKAEMKPVWSQESQSFEPRLMQPLCLSYDHRVIDGAEGARFMQTLSDYLSDASASLFQPVLDQ